MNTEMQDIIKQVRQAFGDESAEYLIEALINGTEEEAEEVINSICAALI